MTGAAEAWTMTVTIDFGGWTLLVRVTTTELKRGHGC